MFLAECDIKRRIGERSLTIEPFDEAQLSGFAIDLRLGQHFRELPIIDPVRLDLGLPRANSSEISLGESFEIGAGETVAAVTAEYVHFPADLAGFLFPRSVIERTGLTVSSATIEPSFQGKIAIVVRNISRLPARLYPGQGILRLCFGQLSAPVTHVYRASGELPGEAFAGAAAEGSDIQRLKSSLERQTPGRRVQRGLSERLTKTLEGDKGTKGQLLESLIQDVFAGIEGLAVMKRNARLRAEEIDLVVRNHLTHGFWRMAGSPFIVECKNWSSKVGAREISVLVEKLQALSPDAKTAILVSTNGITGDTARDAVLKVREARQRGRYILIFDGDDLRQIVEGRSLEHIIEKKYEQLLLI